MTICKILLFFDFRKLKSNICGIEALRQETNKVEVVYLKIVVALYDIELLLIMS